MYTEENAKINWTTRRLGDLPINLPRSFEELEQFKDGHLLECFKSLSKEAIDYETRALHFSAHMFYEKPEIKKQLYAMVNRFAFKNIKSSKKTTKLHTVLSRKANDVLIIEEETSETGLGFVDKFATLFSLRKRLDNARNDLVKTGCSTAYPHIWGNELYNRSVHTQNPFFEKLFEPVMMKVTAEDRERGVNMIVKSLKAQINALKLMMNKDYLVFMNITLFQELIQKSIGPQCSQYVIVALIRGGMVYANKLIWEFLMFKKENIRARDENIVRQ
jgi:hypothetical protein